MADAEKRVPLKGAWSFLNAPNSKDIAKRKVRKAFDLPPKPFDYLVVLDFEWTCDNRPGFGAGEIIEFPSVLVRTSPCEIVDEFQVYCRPEERPQLTRFCTELTAITQAMVDRGVLLSEAIRLHHRWMASHGLLPEPTDGPADAHDHQQPQRGKEGEYPSFAFVTWGDSDLMSALHRECERKGLPKPLHFWKWINLKALFKQHYRREPTGGLQRVVESLGYTFEGRAHSGLVDSRNTAKIVTDMIRGGFRFTRTTRGCGPDGQPYGRPKAGDKRAADRAQRRPALSSKAPRGEKRADVEGALRREEGA
ncbi:unnamed protein product [Vitrella brassicaformis CCMP3155]|uniref:Exonuclease domain-containing protein n=1 Tax=Vitrella brassicaformis (strain CCMP3155) TaxID=1169540 RepID=A0A0G4FQE0_VITBC|nr:unnamed protein product [Vitrella brassicaformis CCMP3155]|eukprot:CEM16655.1 unnamed protein product [Vitrella brassicaformis CCMP3155]